MFKVDLHSHSVLSPDGSLTEVDYGSAIESGMLDFIAITDHNEISFALSLQTKLGNRICIGEEIMTIEGEIIGLFLQKRIAPGLSPENTIKEIQAQKGLVYIPHPFERVRRGVSIEVLNRIANNVDIVEVRNGRAYFDNRSKAAEIWADKHHLAVAASSDAHGRIGWGNTYSLVDEPPSRDNLVRILSKGTLSGKRVGLRGILYPTLNRHRRHPGL